ncbi:hypothetical protein GCM10011504_15580 [Siccirubricoccus deserti]|nr:hypothetical protein GCM10011504_15580 [Siccirubricoccus deserti]
MEAGDLLGFQQRHAAAGREMRGGGGAGHARANDDGLDGMGVHQAMVHAAAAGGKRWPLMPRVLSPGAIPL